MNPTYTHVREQVVDAEAKLKGFGEKLNATRQSITQTADEVKALREENAQFSIEKKDIEREAHTFNQSYTMLAGKLEEAKIAETEQGALVDIKIVADAVLPDSKVAPKRTLIVAVATVLGFIAACTGALFRHTVAREHGSIG